MIRRHLAPLFAMSLVACAHHPAPVDTPPAPPTNHDATCLPVPIGESPVVLQKQADLLKQLIAATESDDPEMDELVVRLAEHHVAGGFVSAGCRIADVAIRIGDAKAVARATDLRMRSCFDGRAQRCTAWYAPG